MPGQLCAGETQTLKTADLRDSKAFCEGMHYRSTGTAAEAPASDNPHVIGTDARVSWAEGWAVANAAAGGTISKADSGCCAMGGVTVSA